MFFLLDTVSLNTKTLLGRYINRDGCRFLWCLSRDISASDYQCISVSVIYPPPVKQVNGRSDYSAQGQHTVKPLRYTAGVAWVSVWVSTFSLSVEWLEEGPGQLVAGQWSGQSPPAWPCATCGPLESTHVSFSHYFHVFICIFLDVCFRSRYIPLLFPNGISFYFRIFPYYYAYYLSSR